MTNNQTNTFTSSSTTMFGYAPMVPTMADPNCSRVTDYCLVGCNDSNLPAIRDYLQNSMYLVTEDGRIVVPGMYVDRMAPEGTKPRDYALEYLMTTLADWLAKVIPSVHVERDNAEPVDPDSVIGDVVMVSQRDYVPMMVRLPQALPDFLTCHYVSTHRVRVCWNEDGLRVSDHASQRTILEAFIKTLNATGILPGSLSQQACRLQVVDPI